jgi:hypothetical protein
MNGKLELRKIPRQDQLQIIATINDAGSRHELKLQEPREQDGANTPQQSSFRGTPTSYRRRHQSTALRPQVP